MLPNLQRGVIQYEGWEKDEKHIYHDYSKDSSAEEKRLFSLWGKQHHVEGHSTAATMNDEEIIAALRVAAEHPRKHTEQHAPRGRPKSSCSPYRLDCGNYPSCQGKTMAEVGLINPGLLRWLLGHTGTGGNSYEWGSSARSIAMALALDELVSNNRVFNHDGGVFTCSWANGPPRCIQEHGAEQRDAVDDVDEIDVDEEADEGTKKFVIYKCLRSTSQTEGYHASMRQILFVRGLNFVW